MQFQEISSILSSPPFLGDGGSPRPKILKKFNIGISTGVGEEEVRKFSITTHYKVVLNSYKLAFNSYQMGLTTIKN